MLYIFFLVNIFVLLALVGYLKLFPWKIPLADRMPDELAQATTETFRSALKKGIGLSSPEGEALDVPTLGLVVPDYLKDAKAIIASELFLPEVVVEVDNEPPPVPETPVPLPEPGGPLVGIYNTHNSEDYRPESGVSKREGENAGIVEVARALAWYLEEQGIPTVRSEQIHDFPRFELSYSLSEKTARRMLQEHPSIQVLIDVHRDANVPQREVITVEGVEVAKILFIVGSDQRLSHPRWKDNLAFAQSLAEKIEARYPGLVKGLRVKSGRYNQHIHPRALLVEFGSDKNTLQEAKEAARLLALVLAEMLKSR